MENTIKKIPKFANFYMKFLEQNTINKIQKVKLKRTLNYVFENSKFYREKFNKDGLIPSDINSLEDLTKLSFTKPEDIIVRAEDFLCVPKIEVAYKFESTGTTNVPKKIFLTEKDLEKQLECSVIGLDPILDMRDRVLIVFAYENPSWAVGQVLEKVFKKSGKKSFLVGNNLAPKELSKVMQKNKINVIVGTPSYISVIAREIGLGGVEKIICGAEPITPFRDLLESQGIEVYDAYGSVESGFGFAIECKKKNGFHYNQFDFILESIDDELVLTTLNRDAMPLVRYKTKDIGFLDNQRCACSSPLERITKISGRADDMFILGTGENYKPELFDTELLGVVSDYRLLILKDNGRDKLILNVPKGMEGLRENILDNLLNVGSIRYDVQTTRTIYLPEINFSKIENSPKPKRIIDKRG